MAIGSTPGGSGHVVPDDPDHRLVTPEDTVAMARMEDARFREVGAKLRELLTRVNDIAEAEDIDRTWRTATGSPLGPFQILDHVGMETYYQINMNAGTEESERVAERVKREFIDQGHMGRSSGQGFYTYE